MHGYARESCAWLCVSLCPWARACAVRMCLCACVRSRAFMTTNLERSASCCATCFFSIASENSLPKVRCVCEVRGTHAELTLCSRCAHAALTRYTCGTHSTAGTHAVIKGCAREAVAAEYSGDPQLLAERR